MIFSATDLAQLGDGEVLVAEMTDPDGEPVLRRAAAVDAPRASAGIARLRAAASRAGRDSGG